jgi:copper(I)-binding protein
MNTQRHNKSAIVQAPMAALVIALVFAVSLVVSNLIGLASAHAAEFKTGMISVTDVWARGTPRSGGAFMVIHNMGPADELVGVRGDAARRVQLHETVSENGVMKMKHTMSMPVPAKGMAMLKPGSYHVMMMGLHKPLKIGSQVPLTLVFKNAGELKIMAEVHKLGAVPKMNMNHDADHKMDHKKKMKKN